MYVYLNSRLVPDNAATVSVFDRGFAYGDSLIETMKILNGRPVFFNEHFQRLHSSIGEAGYDVTLDAEGLRNQALSLVELNDVSDGRLRIQLSRGTPSAPAGIDITDELTPALVLTAEPFPGYPEELYQEGALCATVNANRGHYARLKTASLFSTVLARLETVKAGAWEAVFTGGHGSMLEGSFTNIFFHTGGRLLTAGEEQPILPGVTRGKVIEVAESAGINVSYEAPRIGELRSGEDAAYITSSLLGICPVRQIDQKKLRMDWKLFKGLADGLRELELIDIAG